MASVLRTRGFARFLALLSAILMAVMLAAMPASADDTIVTSPAVDAPASLTAELPPVDPAVPTPDPGLPTDPGVPTDPGTETPTDPGTDAPTDPGTDTPTDPTSGGSSTQNPPATNPPAVTPPVNPGAGPAAGNQHPAPAAPDPAMPTPADQQPAPEDPAAGQVETTEGAGGTLGEDKATPSPPASASAKPTQKLSAIARAEQDRNEALVQFQVKPNLETATKLAAATGSSPLVQGVAILVLLAAGFIYFRFMRQTGSHSHRAARGH